MGKRFVKSPKLYFADQGLAAYLLNIHNYEQWQKHIYKGNLWRNVVFCELIKTGLYKPGKNLFFYRDQNGVEMDFLIEESVAESSPIVLIEAKSSEKTTNNKLNLSKISPLFEISSRRVPSDVKYQSVNIIKDEKLYGIKSCLLRD